MRRIYLSGSISDDPDNYENKFQDAAEKLRGKGFTVINPVELGHIDKGGANIEGSWEYHLMRDLCAMMGNGVIAEACQGIAVIPYKHSEGADLERKVAEKLDLYVKTVDEWLNWTGDEYSVPVWALACKGGSK